MGGGVWERGVSVLGANSRSGWGRTGRPVKERGVDWLGVNVNLVGRLGYGPVGGLGKEFII